MRRVLISAVITAHHEGLWAHKTMLSIIEALEQLNKNKYKYEIIVHMDNPDEETEKYFERYKQDASVRLFTNHFGDLGLSRNFAIQQAHGEFVGVIDADDLTSPNWFTVAVDMVEKSKEPIIVHPEYNLTFGTCISHQVLWTQVDSKDDEIDKILMAGVNPWASMCFSRRATYLAFPYVKAGNGFGNEDWFFNSETMAAGVKHYVAKGVVQFYRKKKESLLTSNLGNKLVQWPTKYLDLVEYKKLPLPVEEPKSATNYKKIVRKIAAKGARKIYGSMLRTPLKYVLLPTSNVVKKTIGYRANEKNEQRLPECVIDEWKKINRIETQLYPVDWRVKNVELYTNADKTTIGEALRYIIEPMTDLPDYVFIVPWLIAGGADKVVINYVKAIKEIHPEWVVAVIATLPSRNEWKSKLPSNTYLLDFGNVAKKLHDYDRECVFDRLIVQLGCRRIHLINSQFGYNYIMDHKVLFDNNFDLNVSIFNYEYIPGSNMQGVYDYADPSLVEIFPVVRKVFTDNASIVKRDVQRNAFDENRFMVHYQPFDGEIQEYRERKNIGQFKILWASRICSQKIPKQVVNIMKKLNPDDISIDMYGKMEDGFSPKDFANVSGLRYVGEFDGLRSINLEEYDAYLYTATSDGVPNVLLEATAAGLPVIASNDGGVGEFIKNGETGVLIEDYLNPDAYVKAIEEVVEKPEALKKYVENAQKLLRKQHSWQSFVANVKRDIG